MTNRSVEVERYLTALEHPMKSGVQRLRLAILDSDAGISECIKWNAPSFATTEHFATVHLRAKTGVQLVLHLGTRPRPDTGVRAGVADPARLLEWRAPDRATITFADAADVAAKGDALADIVRQWLRFVE